MNREPVYRHGTTQTLLVAGEKRCSGCSLVKPLTEFYRKDTTWRHLCKVCFIADNTRRRQAAPEIHAARQRAYREADPWRAFDVSLRHRFGIGAAEYDRLLAAQGGGCAVCGGDSGPRDQRFNVDHDHACCPGKFSCGLCVRGLLCGPCNRMLGQGSDSADRLRAGADYLERWR